MLKQILSTFHHFPSQSWLIIKAICVSGMSPTPRPLPLLHPALQSESFLRCIPVLPSKAPAMPSPGWREPLGSPAPSTAGAAGVPAPRTQPGLPQQHRGGDSSPGGGTQAFPHHRDRAGCSASQGAALPAAGLQPRWASAANNGALIVPATFRLALFAGTKFTPKNDLF